MDDITTELVKITPDIATRYKFHLYDGQRRLNNLHVKHLSDAMTKNLFDPTSSIAFAVLDGNKFLIDGQHTLQAIIMSSIPQSMLVNYYNVKDKNEIARLYSHFNIGRSRSFSDSVRAYGISEKFELRVGNINKLSAAIRYLKDGFPPTASKTKYQHEEMIDQIEKWLIPGKVFLKSIEGCNDTLIRSRLSSMAIMSVGLIIAKYHPVEAVAFMELSQDNGLTKGDPRRAFLYYLRQTVLTNQSGRRIQSQGQVARIFAKCWGKHFDGLSLKNVVIQPRGKSASVPIVIKGTPYTGKFHTVG